MKNLLNSLFYHVRLKYRTVDLAHYVDWNTVEVYGIDTKDYPDFCDAFFGKACFKTGHALSDEQLDILTQKEPETLHHMAMDSVF